MNATHAVDRPRRRRRSARRRPRRPAACGVDGRRAGACRRRRARRGRPGRAAGRAAAAHRDLGRRPRHRRDGRAMLAAALGGSVAAPIVVAPDAPPWIGALDVLILAGDDPGDPALVVGRRDRGAPRRARRRRRAVRGTAARRHGRPRGGARAAAAGVRRLRPGPLSRRRPGHAARRGSRACRSTWPRWPTSWMPRRCATAPARELFTNPAKTLAERMSGREVVLAGDTAATLALARHGAAMLLRVAHQVVAAVGLADALVALRDGMGRDSGADGETALFHDERDRRPAARAAADLRAGHRCRAAGGGGAGWPVSTTSTCSAPRMCRTVKVAAGRAGGPEQQLAMLAVRLEMAAVYLRLVRG